MRTDATDVPGSLDVETLRSVLREHPVGLAILFGSRATGEANASSDVDVAVEFDSVRPSDPNYNDVVFGLSADLSAALETDAVDLVDLRSTSGSLAESVLDDGLLLVGDRDRAAELREQLVPADGATRSPRERFDDAMAKIDAHLDGTGEGVSAAGSSSGIRVAHRL